MKRVISMRKNFKAFGRGNIKFLTPSNPKVLAFLRTYEDETILVVANLSRFSQAAEIGLEDYKFYSPVEVFSQNKFPSIREEPYLITLSPHGYYWFVLQKEDVKNYEYDLYSKPAFNLKKWEELFEGSNLQTLQGKILTSYILTCRWFGGKARTIQSLNIVHVLNVSSSDPSYKWVIFEVKYNEGLPELYQLPMLFVEEEDLDDLNEGYRKGIIAAMVVNNVKGMLIDAVYSEIFQHKIFNQMLNKKKLRVNGYELSFPSNKNFNAAFKNMNQELDSKVLAAEQSNTSFLFNNCFFLKLYRKLDKTLNPDLEITRFLTEKANFPNVPSFYGSIDLNLDKATIVLGMMQQAVPNQGDAWVYFKDSLNRYFERVMATSNQRETPELIGNMYDPADFKDLDESMRELLGVANSERVSLLGCRTAEMHLALASSEKDPDFTPEASSLHYQRSLYSSLQSLVRTTYQSLNQNFKKLPENLKEEASEILEMKSPVLEKLKLIYSRKINTMKIRNHGDYHLGQVLFTGKDFIIIDFEGEPARSFSERRLKRSPLRDVAGMIRSLHYAAYSMLFQMNFREEQQFSYYEKWAEAWFHYMSGFYIKSYLENTQGSAFLPESKDDLKILIQTFLLEKAIYELNYELNNRPDWIIIPIKGIKSIMNPYLEANEQNK
jgi:maltose alpha-D-glucosyltransferase/alpha-amylase